MPYFQLNSKTSCNPYLEVLPQNYSENILFVHIPKTGGTSVETYFLKKTKANRSEYNLISVGNGVNNVSLQHQLLYDILNNNLKIGIKLIKFDTTYITSKCLKIFTIVRNPYYRIISQLFFHKKLNKNSTCDDCNKELILRFNEYNNCPTCYDNHIRPQYQFIYDFTNNKLYDNVIILHQENLNQEMINLGFTDFDVKENYNKITNDYDKFLSKNNIDLINNFYNKDFEYFGYTKLD